MADKLEIILVVGIAIATTVFLHFHNKVEVPQEPLFWQTTASCAKLLPLRDGVTARGFQGPCTASQFEVTSDGKLYFVCEDLHIDAPSIRGKTAVFRVETHDDFLTLEGVHNYAGTLRLFKTLTDCELYVGN